MIVRKENNVSKLIEEAVVERLLNNSRFRRWGEKNRLDTLS